MPSPKPPLLRGVSVYQDLVLGGETVLAGNRDCAGRWEALAPCLPHAGSVLDVGSNLGWFGLEICRTRGDCVVASVEADERSAAAQRWVLQSHEHERICLLTARASGWLARRFAKSGQRFDAVLCLSVLHWIADHESLLETLGSISARLLVEQPDPDETGAGVDRIRREIGAIGPYLQARFPHRPVRLLKEFPSHRDPRYTRQLWLVDEPPGPAATPSPGLEVDSLLACSPGWPPRNWWLHQWERCREQAGSRAARAGLLFTPRGLRLDEGAERNKTLAGWRARLRRLPQDRVLTRRQWVYRRARRLAGRLLRALGIR
jgi:SAM-dependent methyltransferase